MDLDNLEEGDFTCGSYSIFAIGLLLNDYCDCHLGEEDLENVGGNYPFVLLVQNHLYLTGSLILMVQPR